MSTTTTNLELVKPASSENVDIAVINSNYDKIDQFAGGVLNGNYVEDASYVHTDNNFTNTLKNKLDGVESGANNYSLPTASTSTLGGVKVDGSTVTIDANGVISASGGGGGGTTVIANPSGTATSALEKLQVGQTIYTAGGTTVIGNPSGTATADLEKVQIGNNVYNIPVGSIVEANPTVFTPNGTTYTVSITLPSNRTARVSFVKYVNGAESASSVAELTRGGSATDFQNLNAQYNTDGLYIKSKINSIRFGKVIAGTNGILLICNPQESAQEYALEEGNASPLVSALQTIAIDGETYQIPSGGSYTPTGVTYTLSVPVATGMWNGYGVVTQYTDGTMTAQDTLTYAKMASGISNITVGNVKCERTQSSGVAKYVFTSLTDGIECDGSVYNTNETIVEWNVSTYPTTEFSKKVSEVTASSGSSLSDLSDTSITTPTDGQALIWDDTAGKWKNADISSVEANPSGTATTQLTKLDVDGTIYAIPSGGGGGSTVVWNQIVQSGTKIATITIDNVDYDVYAPNGGGASALNDLTDVNINYGTLNTLQVLQYDSANAKWVNAEIPRNLANQGDVALSSLANGQILKYNSTSQKWENSNESGGGTTVVANPSGSATDELNKIQIGNDIYSIPEGSGGDVVNVKRKDNDYTTLTSAATSIDVLWTDVTTESNAYVFHCVKLYYISGDKWYLKAVSPCTSNGIDYDTGDLINSWTDTTQVNFDVTGIQSEGTTVVANPSGTATDTLNKLQVGNDIYSVSGGGASALDDLTDVDIATPSDGQVLSYNSTSGKWENSNSSGGPRIRSMTPTAYENLSLAEKENGDAYFVSQQLNEPTDLSPTGYNYVTPGTSGNASITYEDNKIIVDQSGNTQGYYCAIHCRTNVPSNAVSVKIKYKLTGIRGTGVTTTMIGMQTSTSDITTYLPNKIDGGEVTLQSSDIGIEKTQIITITSSQTVHVALYTTSAAFEISEISYVVDNSNDIPTLYQGNKQYSHNVMANPTGTATDSLSSLKIEGAIYSVGHTILDDAGTSLAQESNLQFKGGYVHDDSTNGKTIVEVSRVMDSEDYSLLSEDAKMGVILVTDEEPDPSFIDITGTLTAGSTTLTFTNEAITDTCNIEVMTDQLGINPISEFHSNGSITLMFDEQLTDVGVKVRVSQSNGVTYSTETHSINYSTLEQDTGMKWLDGKSIYQKSYFIDGDITTMTEGSHVIDASINGIDCILVNCFGTIRNNVTKNVVVLPNIGSRPTYVSQVGNAGLTIKVETSDWSSDADFYVTAQYVKVAESVGE